MNATDLKLVFKLATAHVLHHPIRMLLTLASTTAAACVVVWVVSSYDSLIVKFDEFADNYLGRYELIALPITTSDASDLPTFNDRLGEKSPRLATELVNQFKEDPAVSIVDPVLQTRARITKSGASGREQYGEFPSKSTSIQNGSRRDASKATVATDGSSSTDTSGINSRTVQPEASANGSAGAGANRRGPMLVGTDGIDAPYKLIDGQWINLHSADVNQAAISSGTAEQMNIHVGDEVTVASMNGKESMAFKVVGIIEQRKPLPVTPPIIGLPAMRGPPLTKGPSSAAVYVPLRFAEQIADVSNQFDFVGITLKKGMSIDAFKKKWEGRLASAASPAILQSLQEVDAELDGSTTSETVRFQAYAATGISLLAALFIIFSTLSMGVDERIRQFAMLRAVTCTKAQIAAMLVAESLLLGLVGWGVGLLAGWGLLKFMTIAKPELFPVGSSLGLWCVLLSGACSIGGALAAAVMPAWKATRVKPLEAMSSNSARTSTSIPWGLTAFGLLLIIVNPLLVFWIPMQDQSRYIASAAIGCTCMGIGFVLLAPATVLLTERWLAPSIARLFFINPKLLDTQLTNNLWRTLGATIALTLGLGLFVAMQTWGYSMLGPYTPGAWVPDMVAYIAPAGIPDSEVDAVRHIPGVDTDRSIPCVSEQVKFATDVTGAKIRATSSRQDNCVLLGVDPELAIGGASPVFGFQFASGNRDEAIAKLKQGRYCLVPDHFERESGLTVGDKFTIIPPNGSTNSVEPVEYEIAGAVSMTGWHWMSKVGLRNLNGGRSAGLMFTSMDQMRKDFQIERINTFWLNTKPAAKEAEITASLQAIAERSFDSRFARRGRGSGQANVAIRTREGVRTEIRGRADGIIWLLSRLPLVTLLVTSLGVINTIVSSIRSRQWDLGVMRAVGLTRFGLFRMILCEAILVGAAACLLSFGFGVLAGYCGTGVTRYVNVRGGQITPLIIPWLQIGFGFAITLGLCLVAALWPAIRTGRAEPLRLLQAGRASG